VCKVVSVLLCLYEFPGDVYLCLACFLLISTTFLYVLNKGLYLFGNYFIYGIDRTVG
jgi:hypothetical protein